MQAMDNCLRSVPIKEMSKGNSNSESGERLSGVKGAAQMLRVSVRTVWRVISDGQLMPLRIRGCTRLFFADVFKPLTAIKGGSQPDRIGFQALSANRTVLSGFEKSRGCVQGCFGAICRFPFPA
jgi:hypothetical protein